MKKLRVFRLLPEVWRSQTADFMWEYWKALKLEAVLAPALEFELYPTSHGEPAKVLSIEVRRQLLSELIIFRPSKKSRVKVKDKAGKSSVYKLILSIEKGELRAREEKETDFK